ncbi:DUF4321 domain-containing protein [Bacillus horti]|uniref:DUF4321 domain-containing protein n=1 Tax=Caldalkalibacillus horti TaxID=77523 RepID=A0ABT9VTI5_9BACI|nr:DUF4321 domain-containing protein [Bacillus horti]MDQ0164293.1 hypothetical protein [Bacillus horti]
MQKNTVVFIIVLLIGVIVGSIIGDILSPWVPFLATSKAITWEPKADLELLKYDFFIQVRLNLASILGLVVAIWIYRRLR